MTLPEEVTYGHVVGTFLLAVADGPDEGRLPDSKAPADLRVKFTPKAQRMTTTDPVATIVRQTIECTTGEDGRIQDPQGADGVWLVAGQYMVSYTASSFSVAAHDIEVLPEHTAENPLDLTTAAPAGTPPTTSQWVELNTRIDQILAINTGPPGPKGDPGDPLADTGWRRILSWTGGVQDTGNQLGTINTTDYGLSGNGYLDIRRVGTWVYLRSPQQAANRIETKGSSPASSFVNADLPAGFRVTGGGSGSTTRIDADTHATVEIRSNGGAGFGLPTRSGPADLIRLSGSWWTFEDFPTTLPGTPA